MNLNSDDVLLSIFSAALTVLLYIFAEIFIESRRRTKKRAENSENELTLFQAADSEIRKFAKSKNISEGEKEEALEYIRNDVSLELDNLNGFDELPDKLEIRLNYVTKITYTFFGINFLYTLFSLFTSLPRLSGVMISINLLVFAVFLAFFVPPFVQTRKLERNIRFIVGELGEAFEILGRKIRIPIFDIAKTAYEEGLIKNPYELIELLEKYGITLDKSDAVRATFAHVYPTSEDKINAIHEAIKELEFYKGLDPSDRKELVEILLPIFEIDEAMVEMKKTD